MDWTAPIDLYCERLGAGFWAEPWNAVSNGAFLLAALWGWYVARRHGPVRGTDLLMIVMVALIGVGSFLFHTYANTWSELADVIPIWSFVVVAVLVGMARIGGLRPGRIAVIMLSVAAVLVIAILAMSDPGAGTAASDVSEPPLLNGSLQYAPAVVALLAFSFFSWRGGNPLAGWIIAATATFVLSLAFRTVDLAICGQYPTGTHFIWHLLNGLMIGLILQVMIRAGQIRTPTAPV